MFRNLCISGAGTRGPSLMGSLVELHDQGILKNIRDVCGVSFGAMVAFLWSVGWNPRDLCDRTKDIVDPNMFLKIDVRGFFNHYGLSSTDKLIEYMEQLLKEIGVNPRITFREHMCKTDILLRISALCLNSRELDYFSYITHPNLPIIDAVRASMAIPILFTSPLIDGKYYVDGGVIRHLPYDPYVRHEDETLCVRIRWVQEYISDINSIQTFISSLMTALHASSANIVPPEFTNLINLESTQSGLSFDINRQDIDDMIESGINNTRRYIQTNSRT